MIEPRQIRAARALLNWSQTDLAEASGVAVSSIKNIENSLTVARKETIEDIKGALEKSGVEFTPGSGVRAKTESITVLKGSEALKSFFDDVYNTIQSSKNRQILVHGVEEKSYESADKDYVEHHLARMSKLGSVKQKIIAKKGDTHFTVPYGEYRWIDKTNFSGTPFYVYGDKLAMIIWDPQLEVIILQYPQLVDAYQKQFLTQWDIAEVPNIKKEI